MSIIQGKDASNITKDLWNLPIGAGEYFKSSAAFAARPANTTSYTVGRAWNQNTPTVLTFANLAAYNGGGGTILELHAFSDANKTGNLPLSGEVWFFDGSVTVPNIADQVAWTSVISDALLLQSYMGRIPFVVDGPGDATIDTGNAVGHSKPNMSFVCKSDSMDLKAIVKVTNTYLPVSGEGLSFRVIGKR